MTADTRFAGEQARTHTGLCLLLFFTLLFFVFLFLFFGNFLGNILLEGLFLGRLWGVLDFFLLFTFVALAASEEAGGRHLPRVAHDDGVSSASDSADGIPHRNLRGFVKND